MKFWEGKIAGRNRRLRPVGVYEPKKNITVIKVNKLLNAGMKPEQIITRVFERVTTELDKKCTIEQFNLLEIMPGRAIFEAINN